MRKFVILLTILVLFVGCSVKEKPEFLGVENIKILDATSQNVVVSGDAKFKNPNDIGGKLRTENILVFINDVEMATLVSQEFEVPAKDLFTIPLMVEIPTDSIFSDKSIGGLIGSLFSETLKVQYQGDIKYKVFGFTYTYSINKTENVKIKL